MSDGTWLSAPTKFNFLIPRLGDAPCPGNGRIKLLGNRPLPAASEPEPEVLPFPTGGVVCARRRGGLLKHYRPAA
ncbi:MAG TPA: hypothetical protein VKE40_02145 [Gemmataceae bacterium]|nr:hypothetical protein [Gemmataceae bacterium]